MMLDCSITSRVGTWSTGCSSLRVLIFFADFFFYPWQEDYQNRNYLVLLGSVVMEKARISVLYPTSNMLLSLCGTGCVTWQGNLCKF